MAVGSRHSPYGVKVNTTVLGGIVSTAVQTGTMTRPMIGSGAFDSTGQMIVAQAPVAQFETYALAAALALVGVSGAAISGAGLFIYGQKHAEGGTRAGSTSHKEYKILQGVIIPRRLTVSRQGDAVLSYGVVATYDDTNHPVVVTESVTLPAAPANTERYGLGSVTVGSVVLTGKTDLEIDFGIVEEVLTDGGDIWPTYVSLNERAEPKISLTGIDPDWWKNSGGVPIGGLAATQANTEITLRRRKDGGTYEADEVTSHIVINAAGMAYVDDVSMGGGPLTTRVVVCCNHDGTNAPIVIATGQAL